MMPNTKSKRFDLENGYLEATRDDTDEIQDFRINAYLKDGKLVKSVRCMYNLQYDYTREQIWKNSVLIKDEILPGHGYGHLQWENVYGQSMGPDWDNPYPDNYEPIKPEGTKMFHEEGILWPFFCIELNVFAHLNFYIWEELQDWRKPGRNLITGIHPMDAWYSEWKEEKELKIQKNFDPKKAHEERINAIKEINQYLRCEFESEKYLESIKSNHERDLDIKVPLDPRFIDEAPYPEPQSFVVNLERFKQVLHYIISKMESSLNVGRTVLYTILNRNGFNYYDFFSESIAALVNDNAIDETVEDCYDYDQTIYHSLKEPELGLLRAAEIKQIDDTITWYRQSNASKSHEDVPGGAAAVDSSSFTRTFMNEAY